MKTITKILLAVAAMVAVSCTTDVTEDLGVQLGNNAGQTEITLSLEESRTQLGEKAGNLYPLYWSEGDKISVNGVESSEAVISGENGAVASFSVAANTPYCIAYPATAEGQVLFAEKQMHAGNGTFASGVATMYAYSEDGLGVQMNHLTGVLKIGVTGTAKLTLAQVSNANRKPIAGAFDFDFVKGEAKATTASKEVIEYSFGEGVQLSDAPTYLHVAVPAGEYDELYVTLYDVDGGVMYATIKTDSTKPLTAGNVREFSNDVVYTPTESVFVVKDVASLNEFAAQAATLDKDVLFVADVDMTGEAWSPIEGYAKTVRGNGYAIKGLTAPLFGTTSASIKGLHLRDLNLNITDDRTIVGGLACVLQSTADVTAKVENCSVSGKVVFATTYKSTLAVNTEQAVSPLVAQAFSAEISNCQNNATIEILASSAETTTTTYLCVGGIVGHIGSVEGLQTTPVLTNCVNNKSATIVWNEETVASAKHNPYIGGIVGLFKPTDGTINNCTNYADVAVKSNMNVPNVGGVVGYLYAAETSHLYNYGKVSIDAATSYSYWGGTIGSCHTSTMSISNCENHGDVVFGANSSCKQRFYMAGVIGTSQSSGATYSNLKNTGTIASYGDNSDSRFFVGGVIGYCWKVGELNNCVNGVEGDDTKGKIIIGGTVGQSNEDYYTNIGGIVGYFYPNAGTKILKKCTNYATLTLGFATAGTKVYTIGGVAGYSNGGASEDCHNYGKIDCTDLDNAAKMQFLVGGVIGYSSKASSNCSNSGEIIIGTNADGRMQLGGVIGYQQQVATNCTNSGDITIKSAVAIANPSVAKVRSGKESNRSDVNINNRSNIGGVIGKIYATSLEGTFTNLKNTGDISLPQADSLNCTAIGGVVGEATIKNITLSKSHNEGNISIANTNSEAALVYIGGVLGRNFNVKMASMTINIDECSNKGNITLTEKNAIRHVRAGGIVGDLISAGSSSYGAIVNITNCVNDGNISRTVTTKADSFEQFAGGIVGAVGVSPANADESLMATALTVSGCTNNGDVQFDQFNGTKVVGSTSWGYNGVGGIVGMMYGGLTNGSNKYVPAISSCRNTGKVLARCGSIGGIVGVIRDWGHIVGTESAYNVNEGEVVLEGTNDGFVGGILGYLNETDHTNCDISVEYCANKGAITGRYRLGGIVGTATSTNNEVIKNCVNIGYLKSTKAEAETTVGGIVGKTTSFTTNCQSHCTIEANSCTVGMITATERTETTLVKDCQVGGSLLGDYDVADDSYKRTTLNNSNFMEYIYGGTTDWSGVENHDGNTFLATQPTVL